MAERIVSSFGIIFGAVVMWTAVADPGGMLTKSFAKKSKYSMGFKRISGSARQYRIWQFIEGLFYVGVCSLGLISTFLH